MDNSAFNFQREADRYYLTAMPMSTIDSYGLIIGDMIKNGFGSTVNGIGFIDSSKTEAIPSGFRTADISISTIENLDGRLYNNVEDSFETKDNSTVDDLDLTKLLEDKRVLVTLITVK